jgi:nitrilase
MAAKPSKRVLGGREKVKVAIVQKSPAFMNRDASVARACTAIEEAGSNGADLWLAGYPYWTEGWDSPLPQWAGGRILFRDNALVVPSEDSERIAHAVRRAGVYVVLGCNEMDPRPEVQTIYNSLIFFAPDGTVLGRHRKLMPTFVERTFWGQGDASDLVVFDTEIGRLGGLICGEHVMTLVRACVHDRAGRGHPRRGIPRRIRAAYGAAARRAGAIRRFLGSLRGARARLGGWRVRGLGLVVELAEEVRRAAG